MASEFTNTSSPPGLLTSLLTRCLALHETLAALATHQVQARTLLGGPGAAVADDLPRPLELNQLQHLVKAERRALDRVASTAASTGRKARPHEERRTAVRSSSPSASSPAALASESTAEVEAEAEAAEQEEDAAEENDHEEEDPRVAHVLRSSNLRYVEAVWAAACMQRQLVAFHRRFPLAREPEDSKRAAIVDIVADAGAMWIKVSTVTEKRMLFDLARAGWKSDAEDEASSEGASDDGGGSGDGLQDGAKIMAVVDDGGANESEWGMSALNAPHGAALTKSQMCNGAAAGVIGSITKDSADDDDASEGRSLLRMARQLQAAAKRTWVDYVHPRVVFVLPNIPTDGPASSWAADVLRKVRAEGVEVRCGPLPEYFITTTASSLPHEEEGLFDRLLPELRPRLTLDVNLDCTILLALISDVSHHGLEPTPDLHPAINRQIAREQHRPLLPTVLYPALAGKTLHAATEAADRMREIVGHIGTATEKRRAELLLGEGSGGKPDDPLLQAREWAALSVHLAPPDFHIPVLVEPPEEGEEDEESAAAARTSEAVNGALEAQSEEKDATIPSAVATALSLVSLSAVNRGVWLLGWRRGWTTVTSNRAVARQVEAAVERVLTMEEEKAGGQTELQLQQLQRLKIDETEESCSVALNDIAWRRGPRVWALGTARSLVKKERGLRG